VFAEVAAEGDQPYTDQKKSSSLRCDLRMNGSRHLGHLIVMAGKSPKNLGGSAK
jgi:hypothetical protein